MKNKIIYILLGLVLVVAGGIFLNKFTNKKIITENDVVSSPKNATYIIEGQSVILVNGISSTPIAPDSASKITTQYFGNEVIHDFDHDGRPDIAFVLIQNTGGSGTFYYVVVALNTIHGYVGSNAVLLGDRSAPQSTEISQKSNTPDVIIVNYADRKIGEPFAVKPSIGKSMWLTLDTKTMQLTEVSQK